MTKTPTRHLLRPAKDRSAAPERMPDGERGGGIAASSAERKEPFLHQRDGP